jgi:hypothetical protein
MPCAQSKFTGLNYAAIMTAVALGVCAHTDGANAASLMEWLQSSIQISSAILLAMGMAAAVCLVKDYLAKQKRKVFVLDFSVHKPHDRWVLLLSKKLCPFAGDRKA